MTGFVVEPAGGNAALVDAYRQKRKNAGTWACDACGWTPPGILAHFNEAPVLTVHHVTPVCCGGSDDETNLTLVCPTCHAISHTVFRVIGGAYYGPTTREEFLAQLRHLLEHPEEWYAAWDAAHNPVAALESTARRPSVPPKKVVGKRLAPVSGPDMPLADLLASPSWRALRTAFIRYVRVACGLPPSTTPNVGHLLTMGTPLVREGPRAGHKFMTFLAAGLGDANLALPEKSEASVLTWPEIRRWMRYLEDPEKHERMWRLPLISPELRTEQEVTFAFLTRGIFDAALGPEGVRFAKRLQQGPQDARGVEWCGVCQLKQGGAITAHGSERDVDKVPRLWALTEKGRRLLESVANDPLGRWEPLPWLPDPDDPLLASSGHSSGPLLLRAAREAQTVTQAQLRLLRIIADSPDYQCAGHETLVRKALERRGLLDHQAITSLGRRLLDQEGHSDN